MLQIKFKYKLSKAELCHQQSLCPKTNFKKVFLYLVSIFKNSFHGHIYPTVSCSV